MKKRVFSYDVIRFIAIFFVICIHSQGKLESALAIETNSYGMVHWLKAVWHIIAIAVPLFVMLSGALLLGRQEFISDFFKRRLSRVLIPFVVWSVVLGVMLFYKQNHTLSGCAMWIVSQTFSSGIYHVYWYIYLIIGLYLITPLLRMIIAYGGMKAAKYLVVLIFFLWFVNLLIPSFDLVNRFACRNLVFIGYFVLGYVICNSENKIRIIGVKKTMLAIACILAIYAIGVGVVLFAGGTWLRDLVTVMETIMVFVVLIGFNYKSLSASRLGGGVRYVSEISYGMYLTHCAFVSVLVGLPFIGNQPIVVEPIVLAVGTFILDVIFMFVLKKLKLQKWVM